MVRNLLSLPFKYLFIWSVSSLYITYFLFLLLPPPLHGCPPHLPQAPMPQAGLPSYRDTLPTSLWLNTHTKPALLKWTASIYSQVLTPSYVPTLTCVDTYLLPCLTSPGDFGPNCSDREEEEWYVILRVTFGLAILTFDYFLSFFFGCVRKAVFKLATAKNNLRYFELI